MNLPRKAALTLLLVPALLPAQQRPTPATAAWWATTTALANDSMEGRDTGTDAYERAAKYVAAQFAAAGLKPAGDNQTYFQRVPMHQVALDTDHSSIDIVEIPPRVLGAAPPRVTPLTLLQQVTVTVLRDAPVPTLESPMIFLGYGDPAEIAAIAAERRIQGRVAAFYNNTPASLSPEERASFPARRLAALLKAAPLATISIDNPAATEPTHWPAAYARTVTLAGPPSTSTTVPPVSLRVSAEAASLLFRNSPQDFSKLLPLAEAGAPLPTLDLANALRIQLTTASSDISSPNILAILPGSSATSFASEYVALSAHLDGYGYGTPVLGDSLYNGALDDAAYVATLLEMAKSLHAHPPARSLLFCIFTGEEKGLLGSQYFTQHLTVPRQSLVADLNLDQLRPIFPLHILTMEGLADSTLGETARNVATNFAIEIRPDLEPERNLFRRADNYNFVRIGVPIASFIFGYNRNTPEEAAYRDWYARRYHKPQDDLATPIDWPAAQKFNDFFTALTLAVANAPTRPQWSPASPNAPAGANSSLASALQ